MLETPRFRLLLILAVPVAGLVACTLRPSCAAGQGHFRKLAPGVLTTIAPDFQPVETHSVHDVVEIHTQPNLKWTPSYTPVDRTLYSRSAGTRFHHSIWCLEFSFKPLRMVHVDVPQPDGKMQRKLIWYLVYRVRNTGQRLVPPKQETAAPKRERTDSPVRFDPQFVFQSYEYKEAYLDRVIPVAIAVIRQREDPHRVFLNSVQMASRDIPVSTERVDRGVWGIATWEDIDPRIDFFSIFVQGLTNAYRWTDPPGAYHAGDPPGKGRRFTYKTLKLNFWRPGDTYRENEKEIRYGTPPAEAALYGTPAGVDYAWVYR